MQLNYHITEENGRWILREEGAEEIALEADTREAILNQARDFMKLLTATVKIHGPDGEVVDERVYPRDQHPRETGG